VQVGKIYLTISQKNAFQNKFGAHPLETVRVGKINLVIVCQFRLASGCALNECLCVLILLYRNRNIERKKTQYLTEFGYEEFMFSKLAITNVNCIESLKITIILITVNLRSLIPSKRIIIGE
jgi:hypothetical protein